MGVPKNLENESPTEPSVLEPPMQPMQQEDEPEEGLEDAAPQLMEEDSPEHFPIESSTTTTTQLMDQDGQTPSSSSSAMWAIPTSLASQQHQDLLQLQQHQQQSPKKDAFESVPSDLSALDSLPWSPSDDFRDRVTQSTDWFDGYKEEEQTWYVRMLLSRMHHHQHGYINAYLKPMLQRDFITLLPKKGLDHVAEAILGFLDAKSLCAAELVCR